MEDIKMTNTKAAYATLKPELDAAFNAAMASMQLENGPQVASLAARLEEYLQVRHAIPCADGTIALQIAFASLDLPAGAEVILPAFSYSDGVEVVERLGLKPVFADVLPDTFTLDPAAVVKQLSPATAAIMPVHLFGQCAPLYPILQLADEHQLRVIEDNSQALGAVYMAPDGQALKAGSIGHIGITSFFPTKPVPGAGEGGALCTNDKTLAERIEQLLRAASAGNESMSGAALDTLQAAMLEVKLKIVDVSTTKRAGVVHFYDAAFAASELVQAPVRASYSTHVYQQYTIQVAPEVRDGLREYLRENYIPSMVYYPQPLHLQEPFTHLKYRKGDFPVSEHLAQSLISLPMHTELKQEQLEYICHHVLSFTARSA